MAAGPCQNQSCKSYGRPHPNCRCYDGFAEGGEATFFCSENRAHDKKCKYFAKGGQVPAGFEVEADQEQETPHVDTSDKMPVGFQVEPDKAQPPAPPKDLPKNFALESDQYSTPGQQALSVAEGAIQGIPIIGPVATGAETQLSKLGVSGFSAEDIRKRAEENPVKHGVAKAATAIGSSFIPLGAGARMTSLGAAALQGLLTTAGRQASDEATNWILDQTDPDHPVGASMLNIGGAGVLGLLGNVGGFGAGKVLNQLADKNIGSKVAPYLEGIAAAASGKPISTLSEEADIATKIAGSRFYQSLSHYLLPHMGAGIGAVEGAREGYQESGLIGAGKGAAAGALAGAAADLVGKSVIHRLADAIGKNAVAPFIAKILSSGSADHIGDAINYATNAGQGMKKLDAGLDALFRSGATSSQQALDQIMSNENEQKQKLQDYLDEGGIDQTIENTKMHLNQSEPVQNFADGGMVDSKKAGMQDNTLFSNPGIAQHFPIHNSMITGARARISNYLMGLKPEQNPQKLPFDPEPDQSKEKRRYDNALKIAANPFSVLKKTATGTLDPEDVSHFTSLYPEAATLLSQKVTKKIVQAQLDKKMPPYRVRQSLSLLLGAPLSSDLTPQNIQAAQATFGQKAQQQAQTPARKPKGSSALKEMDDAYRTPTQARAQREQRV